MTKLPGQPAARRHDLHHAALDGAAPRSSSLEREPHDEPSAASRRSSRSCSRDPDFDRFDLDERPVHRARRRAGHTGAGRGGARPLRRARRDAVLVHRGGHRARHRVRRPRRGRDRQRRAARTRRSTSRCSTSDDRRGRDRRGRRGVPALARGDGGLLARPRRRRATRSPPTASCAPVTSAGSTTAAGCGSSGAARRCTCAAATTCTRSRSRVCCRRIPDVAAVAIVPRARPGDGRDRRRRAWSRATRPGPPTLAGAARARTGSAGRRTSSPRPCWSSSRCRSPRGEGRPQGAGRAGRFAAGRRRHGGLTRRADMGVR